MRHDEAKRLLSSLEGDADTIALLKKYIDRQANGEAIRDTYTDRQLINRVEARSEDCRARIADLIDDHSAAMARITKLEVVMEGLFQAFEQLANAATLNSECEQVSP